MKKGIVLLTLLVVASFVLTACGPAATEAPAPPPTAPPAEPTEEPMEEPTVEPMVEAPKVCQVTDVGGIDDKSFNATAYKGIQDAVSTLGVEGKFLESQQQADYEVNINAFLEEGCDLIVTVGFLLGDATATAATANPDQLFTIVDFAYDPTIPNVVVNTKPA